MASVEYQNSILWRGEDPLKRAFKPQRDVTKKIERYRPGKAPAWAEEARKQAEAKAKAEAPDLKRKRRRHEAAVVVEAPREDAAASRLKRLQQASGAGEDATDRLLRHRVVREAQVVEAEKEEKEDQVKKEEVEEKLLDVKDEEPDVVVHRRAPQVKAEPTAMVVKQEEMAFEAEEEEDEEDSSESESEDDIRRGALLKPVFVSKAQRETVKEKEALQREEEAAKEREKVRQTERKAESKSLLVDRIRADEEAEAAGLNENDRSDVELLDDDDEKNEAEEYELWKIRELKRIKRDKEERLARQQELELIERRRRMTDAEREEDDRRMDAQSSKRDEVKQFNFLQKYYHRGGFFQDKAAAGDEPLYLRDYHEPLEEEKFDKQLLPKAMQLRRGQFGKKGQVKHTHLTEVDTTDMSAAWAGHTKPIQKYQEKMAAAKGVNIFDRPSTASRPI